MTERIWHREYHLEEVQALVPGNLVGHLGIELTKLGTDFLEGGMPVDHRTTQPAGLLHGGASAAFAETLGSFAANLSVDPQQKTCVGQEISASHLRPVRSGAWVTGVAKPLYFGKTSQVWEIRIEDDRQRLVCIARLTVAVVAKEHGGGVLRLQAD